MGDTMRIIKFITIILGFFIGYSLLSGSSIIEHSYFSFQKNTSDFFIIIFTLYSSVTLMQKLVDFIRRYLV